MSMTFAELQLDSRLAQAVADLGFTEPTPIQQACIPFVLSSEKDVIALAQTGTGKTAAFGLPLLSTLEEGSSAVQGLILCPTRELCLQIASDLKNFTKYMKEVRVEAVYGGERIDKQIRGLKERPQVVVGTPGRVQDLINRGVLKIAQLRWVVLDEADEMLNMGFKEEIDGILEGTPAQKRTLLFSATMPPEIEKISKSYMDHPERIAVAKRNEGSSNIQHEYYVVHSHDRYTALRRLMDMHPEMYGIIFCRTRRDTQELSDKLLLDGYSVEAIHGELTQEHRSYVMNRFRKRQISFLVATDVAARGIDVQELTHVINFSLPDNAETYVHRSGRTGRADKKGVSLSIVHMREVGKIRLIERKTGKPFVRGVVPGGKEISQRQLEHFIEKLANTDYVATELEQYFETAKKKLGTMTKDLLIEQIVAYGCQKILKEYRNAVDVNVSSSYRETSSDRRDGGRRPRRGSGGEHLVELKISLGKEHGFSVKDLLGMINRHRSLKGMEIGKIKILDRITFFEVDKNRAKEALQIMNSLQFRGERIQAGVATKPAR